MLLRVVDKRYHLLSSPLLSKKKKKAGQNDPSQSPHTMLFSFSNLSYYRALPPVLPNV